LVNDCSIFYPAKDDGSGYLGVPFLCYEKEQLNSLIEIGKHDVKNRLL
jgi:hypothetical protein